jgi:transketolase
MIHGLDHFGYSAPAKRLEQEFGYSGEVVYREVKEFLNK